MSLGYLGGFNLVIRDGRSIKEELEGVAIMEERYRKM